MRQDELVFELTDLMAVSWTEKPAGVLITVKPLTEAVDRIDHQQITALGLKLSAAELKQLLIGSCQGGKTQNRLTRGAPAHQ